MMIQKTNFSYVVKDEVVTLIIPRMAPREPTYVSFNCYALQSRRRFNKFSRAIQESKNNEYDTLDSVYGLARQHGVPASNGCKPTIIETIAF